MKSFCLMTSLYIAFFVTNCWASNPGAEREGLGVIGGRQVSSVTEHEEADYDFESLEKEQRKESNRGPSQDFKAIKKKNSHRIEDALSYPLYQESSEEDYGNDVDYQNIELSN